MLYISLTSFDCTFSHDYTIYRIEEINRTVENLDFEPFDYTLRGSRFSRAGESLSVSLPPPAEIHSRPRLISSLIIDERYAALSYAPIELTGLHRKLA